MTAYLVLLSIGGLLFLLVQGRLAPGVLFTGLAASYYLFGLVDQKTWLSSYTNSALMTLIVLLLVSLALERSALLDRMAEKLLKGGERAATLKLTASAAGFSAFLNNTAVVGAMLGVLTRQRQVAASRLLIPLSYASVLGGMTTLVGTSTNLVVNSFVVGAGMAPLGMFVFAWVGVPVAIACLGVLLFSARMLPKNDVDNGQASKPFLLEAEVLPGSSMIGRSIQENGLRNLDGLFLLEILRGERLISPATPAEILEQGDILVFTGETTKVQALQRFDGLQVFGHRADALLGSNLVEVVLSSESSLTHKTLRDVDFRTMFDAGVVGIRRGEKRIEGQLGRVTLKVGDCLLLAVGPDFRNHHNVARHFHVLDQSLQPPRLSDRQSTWALGGFGAVIALSALEILPLFTGLLILLAVFLVTRLLTLNEMRRRFPFELLLIIGSALTIAQVLESSGAASIIAQLVNSVFDGFGPMGALVGVFLLTLILTELVTNNAAAALAFPIAFTTAKALGVDPTPFIMVVAYGASACFLMPFGYQTHLMVFSPGRYRMLDYIRVGLPVSLTYSLLVLVLVPRFFPF